MDFFSVENIMATIGSYPLSWVEFIGTLSGLICVYLTAKEKVLSWPIGLVNSACFLAIFYQVHLYSDVFLQMFFIATGLYGWHKWKNPGAHDRINENKELGVTSLSSTGLLKWIGVALFAGVAMGYLMSHIHLLLPSMFTQPAAFPYLDSFIATMSVTATYLLTKKKLEAWYFWLAVDVLAVGVYYAKDIKFIAAEYVIFFFLAAYGLMGWRKALK